MEDTHDSTDVCFAKLDDVDVLVGGMNPWSPAFREDDVDINRAAAESDRYWCLSEVDIIRDLSDDEINAIGQKAPAKREFAPGGLIYTPHQPTECLFILKKGRIRIFRVSPDGRALTTAILEPGSIFGEMLILGQRMHDSFAEALDDVILCIMTRDEATKLLLSDPRIAARITEMLGKRLDELEQRLSDTVFKSVPERIAGTLLALDGRSAEREPHIDRTIKLTHDQLGALVASSRETTTKVLGDLAAEGLVKLGRGQIRILNIDGLQKLAGS